VTGDGPTSAPAGAAEPVDVVHRASRPSRSRADHGFDRPAIEDPALAWLRALGE
jgi:hypothetical protein